MIKNFHKVTYLEVIELELNTSPYLPTTTLHYIVWGLNDMKSIMPFALGYSLETPQYMLLIIIFLPTLGHWFFS